MKLTEFMVVVVAALLFLVPMMNKERPMVRQAQEESPKEEFWAEPNTYKVTYEVKTPKEESIADIIWMKKAAAIAKDAGIPYFNVLERTVRKQFVEKYKTQLSIIEGVIVLDNDRMRAEYDAQEIESLILTDAP